MFLGELTGLTDLELLVDPTGDISSSFVSYPYGLLLSLSFVGFNNIALFPSIPPLFNTARCLILYLL